jgi:predicted house-cleaning NTP pyrophosphatase (Maf/HAM1 superfamily)
VRNDEARAPLHHFRERLLNFNLGSGVNRGGCLVENKHRRQIKHYSCYANKLLLTLRKSFAALAEHGVVAVFKPFDKAGAYGIQEWIGYIGIGKIEGSYFTIMGFPVHLVYQELLKFTE